MIKINFIEIITNDGTKRKQIYDNSRMESLKILDPLKDIFISHNNYDSQIKAIQSIKDIANKDIDKIILSYLQNFEKPFFWTTDKKEAWFSPENFEKSNSPQYPFQDYLFSPLFFGNPNDETISRYMFEYASSIKPPKIGVIKKGDKVKLPLNGLNMTGTVIEMNRKELPKIELSYGKYEGIIRCDPSCIYPVRTTAESILAYPRLDGGFPLDQKIEAIGAAYILDPKSTLSIAKKGWNYLLSEHENHLTEKNKQFGNNSSPIQS